MNRVTLPPACRRGVQRSSSVTSQDFIKFWGKFFFAFILNALIENSQGFKTF
jgi:hypothetical protein